MIELNIKPLSVNDAWKGRRSKTDTYKIYQTAVTMMLPKHLDIDSNKEYIIIFEFGFSSKLSDWDNPIKPIQDILVKKYGVDDRVIKVGLVNTTLVPKGKEYVKFELIEKTNKFNFNELTNFIKEMQK